MFVTRSQGSLTIVVTARRRHRRTGSRSVNSANQCSGVGLLLIANFTRISRYSRRRPTMPNLKSGYFSGSFHAVGPFICFFSDRPSSVGFSSLEAWRIRHGRFSLVEVVMGEWVDGKRTKLETVFLRGLTSRQATSSLSRLCKEKPLRHFVKRRVQNELV